MDYKLFAILDKDNVVIDAWMDSSLEEAQQNNPGKTVIECTLENSPFYFNSKVDTSYSL
jgi:hypothetical protein